MSVPKYSQNHRPRELRRRVVIPARLRNGAQWSDTCILNISSRGLMIHSGRAAPKGTVIELRRGAFIIIARVRWRDGGRVGLQSDDRLPIEEILSVTQSKALQLVAAEGERVERRKKPRRNSLDARLRGRVFEFIGVSLIVLALALSVWAMAEQAFAKPLARISAVLGG